VIEDGQKDEDPLQDTHEGKGVEELDLRSVGGRSLEGLEVREQVFQEEGADWDDAEQRVEFSPDKAGPLAGPQRLDAATDFGPGRTLSGGHEKRLLTAADRGGRS